MALTRTTADLCFANLHTSNDRPDLAAEEVLLAADTAVAFAGDAPLVFGGDFNLRPAADLDTFAELERRHGLVPPTAPKAIDHLLARNLDVVEAPHQWPPDRRELHEDGLALRLSDHAPVQGTFSSPGAE